LKRSMSIGKIYYWFKDYMTKTLLFNQR
jgi:hypothetical protein